MAVPSGIILIWSGSIATIPSGFVLCDGNNGTPNLLDRFVVGAGSTYAVDDSGGSTTHSHAFTSDGHNHDLQAGPDIGGGVAWNLVTQTDTDSGNTDNASSLPPYYSLAYIMKT